MSIWLPEVARDESIQGAGGGSYVGGPYRGVLHTTEGGWTSSMSVFRSRMVAPHVMAAPPSSPDGPRIVQFLPLDRSAYALQNDPGGVETNRLSCLQVEIVGFAATSDEWPDGDYEWLGEHVVGPMSRLVGGIDLDRAPPFFGDEAGFTVASETAPQRMTPAAWSAFHGWCGHQHVPENDHWDPGHIDIDKILAAARGEELTVAEVDRIMRKLDELEAKITELDQDIPEKAAFGRLADDIRAIKAKVGA